jgi:hypothetical protein
VALELLADLLSFPDTMGNLQVTVGAGGFDAEEHGGIGLGLPPAIICLGKKQSKNEKRLKNLHYIF